MIRLKHLATAFILGCTTLVAQAQGEQNNWYFGKSAGITFNGDSAVAVGNGRLVTEEGSASISDKKREPAFLHQWHHRLEPQP